MATVIYLKCLIMEVCKRKCVIVSDTDTDNDTEPTTRRIPTPTREATDTDPDDSHRQTDPADGQLDRRDDPDTNRRTMGQTRRPRHKDKQTKKTDKQNNNRRNRRPRHTDRQTKTQTDNQHEAGVIPQCTQDRAAATRALALKSTTALLWPLWPGQIGPYGRKT